MLRAKLHVSMVVLALAGLAACGKEETPGETGGKSTTSGVTGGGGQATGGGGSGGSGGETGGSGGAPVVVTPEDFEGVDVSAVPDGVAPTGCEGGFDADTGALDLGLGGAVTTLLVGAEGGILRANGVACTAKNGDPATLGALRSIKVLGTAADETVILDLAHQPFGQGLLVDGAGITVDLGDGNDAFLLRGSYGVDQIAAGTDKGAPAFDLDSNGKADTFVAGAESLTVSFGPGNDVFHASGIGSGAPLAVTITAFGGAGDDRLQGGAGNDVLHGGAGDDVFETADKPDGKDVYDGGDGQDLVDYRKRTAPLAISLDGQANDGESGEHDELQASMEGMIGGSGDDVLLGGPGDDQIHGGAGNDLLRGGAGSDTLRGEDGDDVLEGEDGDDYLYGDAGDDQVSGGPGSDMLDGGGGKNLLDAGASDGDICIASPTDIVLACELY